MPLTETIAVSPYGLFEQILWERPENTDTGLGLFPMEGWNTYLVGLNWSIGSNYKIKNELAYGEILTKNPKDNNSGLIDYSVKQGDMDVYTFSTQFSMAF